MLKYLQLIANILQVYTRPYKVLEIQKYFTITWALIYADKLGM